MEHDVESHPARRIAAYLRSHGLVLVTAESCTAGLIAARLAEVPGAGKVLESAFVVYDPASKQRCLGVPPDLIERHNLTSEPVALAMAEGALRHSDADLAVANTGVADDTDPDIERGTQCFAWVFRGKGGARGFSETRVFGGSRNQIREASAGHALLRIPHYHALLAEPGTAHC
ncbi:MAG: CinA family protein [Burkholderiaceae bacterium]|jgi:PncC family amidohydrolase|nr:CinA family protein [Burkholderiaceae bacterium]